MVPILVFNAWLNACSILVFNMLFLFVLWALNSLTFLVFFFLLQAHQRVLNAELDMEGVNDDKSRVGSMCALCLLTIFSIETFLNPCFLFGSWFLFELFLFFSITSDAWCFILLSLCVVQVTKECENMIKSFKKKLKQSDNDINSKNVVIETLKDELKEKEITIKNGDSKQLRIIQLENSLLQQKKTFARNFSKLRIAHRNEMQSIDVQMSMLRKDADQRASAVKENAGLKRDLSS